MRNLLFLTALFAALLTGCKTKEIIYTPPPLADDWSATLTQSGGIAGISRSLRVASDGAYQIADGKGDVSKTGTLTEAQLAELTQLISTLQFAAPKSKSNCADCFNYAVTLESGGQKMIVQTDDTTLDDSGIKPLVLFLRGILDSA